MEKRVKANERGRVCGDTKDVVTIDMGHEL